jgi:predicted regulator of Ras-like GTPase activity (Roadblock/LC7/MglB family)
MDAQQALADLTEVSSQIQAAVMFDDEGRVAASTLAEEGRAAGLAQGARRLLEQAQGIKVGDGGPLTQLEAATQDGSVFVVADGKTRIAATTAPEPTVGLVFYDLKSALRSIAVKPTAKRPVRAGGTGKGVPGEPGGSPAPTAALAKPAASKKTATTKQTAARKKPAPRKKKPDAP